MAAVCRVDGTLPQHLFEERDTQPFDSTNFLQGCRSPGPALDHFDKQNQAHANDLAVLSQSGQGLIKNGPGGAVAGSGSFIMTYPKSTKNQTRIDYASVEKIVKK